MEASDKKILVIGVFHNADTKHKFPCSVPEQLYNLFKKNDLEVLSTSKYLNRVGRFLDTVSTIIIKKNNYDLAIVPWYNGTGSFYWQEIATKLLSALGKKIILVMHGGGIPDLIDKTPGKYLNTIRRADLIVCPSRFIQSRLAAHNISSVVVENHLNLKDYPFIKKENFDLNILWMRTLEPLYNPVMALKVGRVLKQKNLPFAIHIAGQDKGYLQELIAIRKEYNLENEVSFCGLIDHPGKLKMAVECDFYICTNKVDNAPVSLIEMMSLGLPIVSTNVGGIPHFITDGSNGFLVEDEAVDMMVDKLVEIHFCPTIGRSVAEKAFEFSRSFEESKVIDKWKYYITSLRTPGIEYDIRPATLHAISEIEVTEQVLAKSKI